MSYNNRKEIWKPTEYPDYVVSNTGQVTSTKYYNKDKTTRRYLSQNPDKDGYVVETCDEDEIMNNWWSFETENAIVNTLAPSYEDYCSYVQDNYVFMWNTVEQYGYYNNGWSWNCKN